MPFVLTWACPSCPHGHVLSVVGGADCVFGGTAWDGAFDPPGSRLSGPGAVLAPGDSRGSSRIAVHAPPSVSRALEAQSPDNPEHVDRHLWRGRFHAPEPVRWSKARGSIADRVFDLSDVALDRIGELARATLEELGYERAKVSHVIVERNLPFSEDVVIRVDASGPRASGRVEYRADGALHRVYG